LKKATILWWQRFTVLLDETEGLDWCLWDFGIQVGALSVNEPTLSCSEIRPNGSGEKQPPIPQAPTILYPGMLTNYHFYCTDYEN